MSENNQECVTCYRIACKKCAWVASEEEVLQIQQRILTCCPVCGWKPADEMV